MTAIQPASVRNRTMVLAAVLTLMSVPMVVALVEAVSYQVRYRSNGFLVSSGRERDYVLHVPRSYTRDRPTPLVISMHGAGLWGAAQREISEWDRVADREGFIVVYPSGEGHGLRVWGVDRGPGLMRDVRFIAALIDTLAANYNIDSTRIYANGLSNGGGMSFVLSCTMSDRIAAIGLVGAAQTLPFSWCTDKRAVPMISFHGTDDNAAPYNGGSSWVTSRAFPSAPGWASNWARRNGCAPTPIDSAVAMDVTRRTYIGCVDDATVVLYTIHGGGHTWPGGAQFPEWFLGSTSRSIDASTLMWEFFREHPLSRK